MNIFKRFRKTSPSQDKTNAINDNIINENDNLNSSDIELMFKYGKSSNIVGGFESVSFMELPYATIKRDIVYLLKENSINEVLELIFKPQFKNFNINKVKEAEKISFIIWINEQLERVFKIEEQFLQSEPEPELIASGIDRLNEFGINPLMEKIAKDWNKTPEEIEKYPYFKIYQKIKMDKVQSEINKRYQKIIEEKSKAK